MLKHIKLVTVIILALILAAGAMTGCAGGGKQSNADNFFEKDADHDYGGKEFKIMAWWDSTPAKGSETEAELKKIAEKYNISEIKWISVPDMDAYISRLTTDIASGQLADVCWILEGNFVPLVSKDMFTPLENYDFGKSFIYLDGLSQGFKYKEKQYGLVSNTWPEGLVYNRTLVQKAGFEDPQKLYIDDKWTWEKFREICKGVAVPDANGDGKFGITLGTDCTNVGGMLDFAFTNDSDIVKTENGKVMQAFDSTNTMEALQFIYNLIHVDKVAAPDLIDISPNWGMFNAGHVAFLANSGWGVDYVKAFEVDFQVALVPFPKGPKAKDNKTTTYGASAIVFPKGSKDPLGASKVFEDFLIGEVIPKIKAPDGTIDTNLWNDYFKREKLAFSDNSLMRMCTDEADIPNLVKIFENTKSNIAAGYGYNTIINEMMAAIGAGTEQPASAVASRKQQLQDQIDRTLGQ